MVSNNLYEILGIDKHASQQEIKDAYRRLAHKHHPDKATGEPDGEEFINMVQAYNVLKDENKRRSYDEDMKKQKKDNSSTDSYEVYSRENSFDLYDDILREIFESFFERSASKSAVRKSDYDHRHYDDLLD